MPKQTSRAGSRSDTPSQAEGSLENPPTSHLDVSLPDEQEAAPPAVAETKDSAPESPPAFAGWARIDGDNVLRGWVTDRNDRSTRATIDIKIDDEPIASLRADLFDPKLVELGEGDGRYAFAMVIPMEYRDGREHRFDVFTRGTQFIVRSKQPLFVIDPDQTTPHIEIRSVSFNGITGALIGGQYSKSAALYFWNGDSRLDLEVSPVWTGGHEIREFHLGLTAEIIEALAQDELVLAASGMVEAGLDGARIQPIQASLTALCDDSGLLALALESPLSHDIHEVDVEVREASDGETLFTGRITLLNGEGELVLPEEICDRSLTACLFIPGVETPLASARIVRSIHRLTANSSFDQWSGSGLADWECPDTADAIVRGFYAFPDRIALGYGVRGDYVHFTGNGEGGETLLLRQALERIPPADQPIDAAVLFRSAEPVTIRLRIVDSSGAELGSAEADSRRAWTWAFATASVVLAEPVAGPVYFEVVSSAGDVAVDVAGARFGGHTFADPAIPPEPVETDNLVENADLSLWPQGVKVELVGRGEIAAGWFAFNRRSSAQVTARAIFADADTDRTGLAVAVDKVPEYCRLEIRLSAPDMSAIEQGLLTFEAGTPAAARRLFSSSAVALPEFIIIDRIMLLRRSSVPTETGFSLVDETLAVVGRKLVISRGFSEFELPFQINRVRDLPEFDWEIEEEPSDSSEYFMVFEFRQPFAVALRGVSVTADGTKDLTVPVSPYLALEDRNISAQAGHIQGLAAWVGSAVVEAALTGDAAPREDREFRRWRWSAASAGSVEIVICVYNAVEETLACLNSLIGSTHIPYTVRIIDDGSEPSVHRRLADFVNGKPWMRLCANPENRGYTYSADRGVRESDAEWVVLLNSDTIVTPGWLEGLVECAVSDPLIGFVGPLSNAATFQSVPDLYDSANQWKTNDLPPGWTPARMGSALRELSARQFPDAPLLNGFCTLMRRSVFLEVGGLNHSAFPMGYGEENDLCLRVRKAGYRLALADHVYVYHSKSASFGSARRTELAKAGGKALKELHPDVDLRLLTSEFRDIPALVSLRAAIRSVYENKD
jgi:GT2 family glycosyltransferase